MIANSLASRCPELIKEWSNKNDPLTPDDITYGSNKKVWWIGECGHEWQSSPHLRNTGVGCPFCSGNKVLLGFNDFASTNSRLVEEWSEKNKLSPFEITRRSPMLVHWRCKNGHEWYARAVDRADGSGCPYCTGTRILEGYNDLKTVYPELSKEWSPKNSSGPEKYSPKSRTNVWWVCSKCGHEWKSVINTRVKGSLCPICSDRKVFTGKNDLLSTNKDICKEWNYEKNEKLARPLTPQRLSMHSTEKVWWKGKCGHEWKDRVVNRTIEKQGCLVCESEFLLSLPQLLILYYSNKVKLKVRLDDEKVIGIKLDGYIPDATLAFISLGRYENSTQITVADFLCKRNDISLVKIKSKTDKYTLAEMIVNAFRKKHIYIKTDIEEDLIIVRKMFDVWKDTCRRE